MDLLWGGLERCGMLLLFVFSGRCGKNGIEELSRTRKFLFIGLNGIFCTIFGLGFFFFF